MSTTETRRIAIRPILDVWVPGVAQPKGSKTPTGRRGRNVVLVESADMATKNRPAGALAAWSTQVANVVSAAWNGQPALDESVSVDARFRFPRPSSYRAWALYLCTKPDADKCFRAVGDALVTAGVIREDSRIVDENPRKKLCRPGQEPGVQILVWAVGEWEQAGWALEETDTKILVRKEDQW